MWCTCFLRLRRAESLYGDNKPEYGTFFKLGIDPDNAAHEFHQLPTNREAEPRATKATSGRIIGLLERYKQEIHVAR